MIRLISSTPRTSVREFTTEDLPLLSSPLADGPTMTYCGGVLSAEDCHQWMGGILRSYDQWGYDYWATFESTTGRFVGQELDCLSYMVHRDFWGRGYGREIVTGCLSVM